MTRPLIFVSFLLATASVALAQDQYDYVRIIADRIEIAPVGDLIAGGENGDTIEAEFAELSRDLQNGLLKSARIMLENQLELQVAEMERIDGITAELRGVAATSCISCDTRPSPVADHGKCGAS